MLKIIGLTQDSPAKPHRERSAILMLGLAMSFYIAAILRKSWINEGSMARIILLQLVAALVVGLLAGIFGNISYGLSALFGGLSCAIPNALFALRLSMSARRPGGANPMSFFIGEFFKVISTVALMAAVVFWYPDVNWPAFLIAFIVVLKSYFILLFRH